MEQEEGDEDHAADGPKQAGSLVAGAPRAGAWSRPPTPRRTRRRSPGAEPYGARDGWASRPIGQARRLLDHGHHPFSPRQPLDRRGQRAAGVELAGGERLAADAIVAAVNPQTALLDLVGAEQLPAGLAAEVRALHRGNAVQFVVHAALDRLPPYAGAEPGDWSGMQSLASSVEQVARAFAQAEVGAILDDPPLYAFTPSALDPPLAPPGKHTLYLACPAYPGRLSGGRSWDDLANREGERLLRRLIELTPSLAGVIGDFSVWHPLAMERELGLRGGHPMYLDLALDQLGPLRPGPALRRREALPGLFLTGAGTSPTGGVVGTPGRQAARAVLGRRP